MIAFHRLGTRNLFGGQILFLRTGQAGGVLSKSITSFSTSSLVHPHLPQKSLSTPSRPLRNRKPLFDPCVRPRLAQLGVSPPGTLPIRFDGPLLPRPWLRSSCVSSTMESLTNHTAAAFESPLANAQIKVAATSSIASGVVSRYLQQLNGWTIALSLLLIAITYDQRKRTVLPIGYCGAMLTPIQ